MKIIVTGGNGYVAGHLKKKLEEQSHEVISYDLPSDIRDRDEFNKWIKYHRPDVVYHLATNPGIIWCDEHPTEAHDINVYGSWVVALVCAENNVHLNFISTCCAYGNVDKFPITEETLPKPTESYACNKLAGEYIVKGYHISTGMSYNILRLATMYGPSIQPTEKRPDMAIPIFFDMAMKGQKFTIHGDGLQTRTYTYIEDIADALVLVNEKGIKNETITLTNTEEISVIDIANKVKKLIPTTKWDFGPDRKGQIRKEVFDTTKARTLLGWEPKVNFDKGMYKYYEWLKSITKQEIDNEHIHNSPILQRPITSKNH